MAIVRVSIFVDIDLTGVNIWEIQEASWNELTQMTLRRNPQEFILEPVHPDLAKFEINNMKLRRQHGFI